MGNKVLGYNIGLKLGTKKILGTTQDNFKIEGVRKESIMKADAGIKQYDNDGSRASFSVTAFVMKKAVAEADVMDIQDIRQACAQNSQAAFVYGGEAAGDYTVSGNAMFLSCAETSDSENYATVTIELEMIGDPVFGTVGA
ncbi:MAG TPA: hypothetical protein PK167_03460 [Prolixibacteraceae bacterium]|nr:hypothetical protein [Prolixibacteraceae bacterium]